MMEISKKSIVDIYGLIIGYLNEAEVEESAYIKLVNELEKHKIAIPLDLYNKVIEFVKSEISILTYNYEKEFENTYNSKYGKFNESIFEINDDSLEKVLFEYLDRINTTREKFEIFSEKQLRKYMEVA